MKADLPAVFQVGMLLIALALTVGHFYAEPARWRLAYVREKSWQSTRDLFFATSLASYLLPFKLGIPLRLVLSSRVLAIGASRLATVVAIDTAVTLAAWGSIALVAGGKSAVDLLSGVALRSQTLWVAGGAVALALLALCLGRVRRAVYTLWTSVRESPKEVVAALALAMIDVLSYGPRHAAIAIAIGLSPDRWGVWASCGIVATFAGIASGMPMGLVGYDATLMLLLGATGVDSSQALIIVAINRVMSIASAVLLGLPAAYRLGLGGGMVAVFRRMREMARGR